MANPKQVIGQDQTRDTKKNIVLYFYRKPLCQVIIRIKDALRIAKGINSCRLKKERSERKKGY
jgi:hypothetical protein